MIKAIIKRISKRYGDISSAEARRKCGEACGVVGIVLNAVLFAIKLLAGLISNSVAITADALNNLSDAGSSVITLVGFRISSKKPDSEHPFGHGRAEYISALLVAIMILAMGAELLKSSIKKIIAPEPIEYSAIVLIILIISVAIKLYMAFYNRKYGALLASDAMNATYHDSLCDAISTFAVLCAVLAGHLLDVNIDGWCGAAVALFILYSGIRTVWSNINTFLGKPADSGLVAEIDREVMQNDGIIGVHDIVVHDYGPGKMMVTLHAEVPANLGVLKLHEIIEKAEEQLADKYDCRAMIHMDPVSEDDEHKNVIRKCVYCVLHAVDARIGVHDFRVDDIDGNEHISFDAEVPYDIKTSDKELKEQFVAALGDMFADASIRVTIDRK